jgi:hypothetical protein
MPRVLKGVPETIPYEGLHIIVTNHPYTLASRYRAFDGGFLNSKVILSNGLKAVMPREVKI